MVSKRTRLNRWPRSPNLRWGGPRQVGGQRRDRERLYYTVTGSVLAVGRSTRTLDMLMRTLLFTASFLSIAVTYGGSNQGLRDVDIEEIVGVVRSIAPTGRITQMSGASHECERPAEDTCQAEVEVRIAGDPAVTSLTVSKIDDHWHIGQRQREALEFLRCIREAADPWQSCIADRPRVEGERSK